MPDYCRSGRLLVVLCFSAYMQPAFAHIEEILVEGKIYVRPGITISASQGTINQQDIASRPRLRTGDILELIPGMVITQHSGTGKSNQMFFARL